VSVRCNLLGLHQWGPWRDRNEVTKYLVRSIIGHRMPEEDFSTTRLVQVRRCKRCGLTQRRTA